MIPLFNRNHDLTGQIKTIVRQLFPAVSPSTLAMEATESTLRGGGYQITTKRPGSSKERFVWGVSRMGCSRLVG